jgi:hypothetical protein
MNRLVRTALGLLIVVQVSLPLAARGQGLTRDSEPGFLRFIGMAEAGELGDDVINANVGVMGDTVRIELVRKGAPSKILLLTLKRSRHSISRYFDIAAEEGADENDVRLVGEALDRVFSEDPFRLAGNEALPGDMPATTFMEAWSYRGWKGVQQAIEQRMMTLITLPHAVAVIVLLGMALLAGTLLLWTAVPPLEGGRQMRRDPSTGSG